MDVLTILTEKLAKHPELKWTKDEHRIRVDAPHPAGFALELQYQGGEWAVYLGSGGWHQHFDDGTKALEFIAWCYSGEARVREVRRGNVLQKSVLEACIGGSWQQQAVVGYFFAPFWRKKAEIVLQNPDLLSAE